MATETLKQKTLEKQLRIQPKEVQFCKKCVVSNQRPRIAFDEEGRSPRSGRNSRQNGLCQNQARVTLPYGSL